MYAMLTGNLPFTVEPFNIKSLHNKMVNSQMNPLPEGVTRGETFYKFMYSVFVRVGVYRKGYIKLSLLETLFSNT